MPESPACWRCDQIRAAIRDDPKLCTLTAEFEESIVEIHTRKHLPIEATP